MVSGKITIWVGKELHEACKKSNINISQMFRTWLAEKLKEANIEVKVPEPEIILLVQCIHCGNTFSTSSIGQVRCPECQKTFKVYVKRGFSRIKKILKGDMQKLMSLYQRRFKGHVPKEQTQEDLAMNSKF
jgi:DNA-directed RNA polymerase subunit RPC12/RpoP